MNLVRVNNADVLVTHIWDDDGQLWVECVVHFADGSFVTPEGIIVLTVLGVWVADRSEHLVPGGGVGVRLRNAVWWLPVNGNKDRSHALLKSSLVIDFLLNISSIQNTTHRTERLNLQSENIWRKQRSKTFNKFIYIITLDIFSYASTELLQCGVTAWRLLLPWTNAVLQAEVWGRFGRTDRQTDRHFSLY